MPRRAVVVAVCGIVALASAPARAADDVVRADDEGRAAPLPHFLARKGGYLQLFATTFVGTGLRFNNPYRLATVLGVDAQSVSRTAAYVDLGLAVTLGNPQGFQHGLALRMSFAVEGVTQTVLAPSYVLYRRWGPWAGLARVGVPLVATPTANVGIEGAVGAVFYVRGGLGVAAELVGDLFYGAGTREVATPAYPVLSGQLGLVFAYEVLP